MKKCKELRKRVIAMLCAVTMTAVSIPFAFSLQAEATYDKIGTDILEENDGNLNRIRWNNAEIKADISAGFNAITVVLDVNNDGNLDIMSVGRGVDSLGTMVYYGTEDSQNPKSENYMVLGEGLNVREKNNWVKDPVTVYDKQKDERTEKYLYGKFNGDEFTVGESVATRMLIGQTYYMDVADYVREDFDHEETTTVTKTGSGKNPTMIDDEPVLNTGKDEANKTQYYWLYDVDKDEDGRLDLVWFIDQFKGDAEYGGIKNDKFDDNGVWGDDDFDGIGDDDDDGDDDPQHCWVVWCKNEGTNDNPIYREEGIPLRTEDNSPIECYGQCDPQMQDWDADGDLDIICGSFIDEITYFENTGNKDANGTPIFEKGRAIPLSSDDAGEQVIGELKAELCVLELTNCDWNKDGYMDLVVTEEDGRCFLVQNTKKTDNNGTPIMVHKEYFKAPAGNLQAGCLPTPVSVDWDGDDDEDIICGNSAGFLNFIENKTPRREECESDEEYLAGLQDPVWGPIKRLKTPDGKDYRIQAGYNGSTQGPNEKVWGYTMVSVADWDGDDVLDIMHNNVWGKVLWHKGIEGSTDTIGYAQPVEVEWSEETLAKYDGYAPHPDWLWWNPEGDELVTQWRTTPFMVDLPLDEDGDGEAKGDDLMDLVMMDQEGYLCFYQRYQDSNGVLKLKEGQRIFVDKSTDRTGKKLLQLNNKECGDSGKNSNILVDWDKDGDLDLFKTDEANKTPIYYENISKVAGKYEFCKNGEVSNALPEERMARTLKQHDVTPTACDWNKDGIPDLIMANEDGFFYYLKNNMVTEVEDEVEDEIEEVVQYAELQKYLVTHWDFEDENPLADKAPAGRTQDDLSRYNSSNSLDETTADISIKDGVATIKDAASLRAPTEADLGGNNDMDLSGQFTIVMKVKLSALPGSKGLGLFYKGAYSSTEGYFVGFRLGQDNLFLKEKGAKFRSSNLEFPIDEFVEVALVYESEFKDDESGEEKNKINWYLADASNGITDQCKTYEQKTPSSDKMLENGSRFIIGNAEIGASSVKPVTTSVERQFDDIKVFDKALTLDELKLVSNPPTADSTPDTPTEEPELPARGELVAHWDFEGTTEDERLQDKAQGKGGTVADNLTIAGTGTVTFGTNDNPNDGTVGIKGAAGLKAKDSVDLSQTGAMTIFVRAKSSNAVCLIDKLSAKSDGSDSSYKLEIMTNSSGKTTVRRAITSAGYSGDDHSYNNAFTLGEWREIALVIDKTNYGVISYKVLVSKGESTSTGNDFLVFQEGLTCDTKIVDNTVDLIIGNDSTLSNKNFTRRFDDVRIYNYALTEDELAEIDLGSETTTTSTYLKGLENNVGLAFRPSNTAPSTVNTNQTTVSFKPEADDTSQKIEVDGETVVSGTAWTKALVSGENTFTVEVTNGTASKTYTIKVNCTVPTADALQEDINEAKAIEQGTYTASSYEALKTAIESAREKVNGSIGERKLASEALATAVAELTTRLRMEDLSKLESKVTGDGHIVDELMDDVNTLKAPSSKEITAVYNELLKVAMGIDDMILQPEVTDSIAMVYKNTITSSEAVSMTFAVDGEPTEAVVTKNGNAYTFTYPNVYAQNMAQTIEATLTVGDYSRVYKTSFLDYCVDVMNDEEKGVELKGLIVDLVKYGESVQVFRGDVANRNELLTNKFVARQKFISTYTLRDDLWTTMGSAVEAIPESNEDIGYVSNVLTGDVNGSYKWSSMRLVLKDEVNLRCKFTASDISNLVVKVTINNQPYEYNKANFKMVADNTYELDFGEIYANEYGKEVTFEFVNNGEKVGQTLKYSVNTYLYNKRASETANLKQLLLAIYKYGLSANACQSPTVQ